MLESQQALKLLEENRERVDTRSEFTLAWQRLNVISSSFNHWKRPGKFTLHFLLLSPYIYIYLVSFLWYV